MLESIQNKLRLSKAAQLTLCLFVALLVITLTAWGVYQFDSQRVAWGDYMTWERAATLLLLLVATLTAVYWTLRLWFEDHPAQANDVEVAWQAGIRALAKVGISIQDLPVFLFVGCPSSQEQKRFLAAGEEELVIDTSTSSNAPLNWFASKEAIYLFAATIGNLGPTLQKFRDQLPNVEEPLLIERHRAQDLAIEESQVRTEGTIQDSPAFATHTDHSATGVPIVKAAGAGDKAGPPSATAIDEEQQLAARSTSGQVVEKVEQSLSYAELLVDQGLAIDFAAIPSSNSSDPFGEDDFALTSNEILDAQQQLIDLGTHLRNARRPAAAINGIGVIVDLSTASRSPTIARRVGRAIRQDLDQLEELLGVQCPTTLILTASERQPGLSEAIRRSGPRLPAEWILGAKFDPRSVLNRETPNSITERSSRSLGGLVYGLFRAPDALATPGNQNLAKLLFAARGNLRRTLQCLTQEALATKVNATETAGFFSGLTFAAVGHGKIDRGFVRPILSRMRDQQQFLRWSHKTRHHQHRTNLAASCLIAICLANAVALCWQLWTK